MGNFCHKTASLAIFINCSHSMTGKSSIWNEPMKGSQPNTVITVGGKHSSNKFCIWDAQVYHVLHLDTVLPYSSIYWLTVLKQSNLFCCTLGTNFKAATLSSAVGVVLLWPWIDRLNLFNLLKMSARYASCCKHRISEQ